MIPDRAAEPKTRGAEPHVPSGLTLQWHITERCNLRCTHCYQEGGADEELPYDGLLLVLEQFKSLLGACNAFANQENASPVGGHITVTGGEPFIRRDFLDLLEALAANARYFSFAILTNGTFIDAAMARRLRELGPASVQLSIEGGQATHDGIRGAGDLERTVAAAERLVREGVRTHISFTAHRGNFREFADVARLGRELGVARVWADRLIPWGTGSAMKDQLLTQDETREFFEIMHGERLRAEQDPACRTEIAMHRALQFLAAGGKPYHCGAGDSLITLQADGDLYPCRRMPIRVGNVMERTLCDLYFHTELFQELRDRNRISEGCEGCEHLGTCGGGLKCLSYAVTGDPFQADPGCWLASRGDREASPNTHAAAAASQPRRPEASKHGAETERLASRDAKAHLMTVSIAYRQSAVLLAACKLGVFATLVHDSRSAGDLARELELDARALETVLLALAAEGILQRQEDGFRIAPAYTPYLLTDSPDTQAGILNHNLTCLQRWSHLTDVVRTGKPVPLDPDPDRLHDFVRGMADVSKASSAAVVSKIDLSSCRRMLDVGGGPATAAITFTQRWPNLTGVVLDLEDVIPIARERIEEAGLGERIEARAGDYLIDDFGQGFDLVYISNVINSLSPESARVVVEKSHRALTDGGTLILKDYFLEEDRITPAFAAYFSVNMLVSVEGGRTYTWNEARALIERTGFRDVEAIAINAADRLLIARKASES